MHRTFSKLHLMKIIYCEKCVQDFAGIDRFLDVMVIGDPIIRVWWPVIGGFGDGCPVS